MAKILTIIYVAIACLAMSLALGAISCPTNFYAVDQADFTELSIFRNGPDCRNLAHAVVITDASAPVYGDEDSGTDKDSEKDDKDEDQGQIRLWDSVLLG